MDIRRIIAIAVVSGGIALVPIAASAETYPAPSPKSNPTPSVTPSSVPSPSVSVLPSASAEPSAKPVVVVSNAGTSIPTGGTAATETLSVTGFDGALMAAGAGVLLVAGAATVIVAGRRASAGRE